LALPEGHAAMPQNGHLLSPTETPDPWRWAVVAILAASAIVFVAGLLSEVVLGDEVYHTVFAQTWAGAGPLNRPTHPPIYASGQPPGYAYLCEPLWALGLSLLWHVTGTHTWVAQAYQATFYMLLLASGYGLGRRVLGPQGAMAALLTAISVPMFGAFGILLYVDVPATAIVTVAILMAFDRRYALAGLAMGLAYITKRNTFFLLPPMLLWITAREKDWIHRIQVLTLFLVLALLPVLPDLAWRKTHLYAASDPVSLKYISQRIGNLFATQKTVSSLNRPFDLLKYFGLVVPILGLIYLVRQSWRRDDRWLWFTIALYLVIMILFFSIDTDIRYAMPMVPLLALVVARGLTRWWEKRWVVALVALAAFGHLGATACVFAGLRHLTPACVVVGLRHLTPACIVDGLRHLTPAQRTVFTYLREHTPEGTLVLYPGEVLMKEAQRPVVWAHLKNPFEPARSGLRPLLTETDPDRVARILRDNHVRYVCVDEHFVSAETVGPVAGYPRAFVDRLPQMSFLEKVPGPWPGVILWKVKDEATP